MKKDFPEVLKIVKTIHEDLKVKLFDNEELFNKIDNNVDEILEENKFLEFKDPILDVYKMFHKVPSLSKNETDFLIEQYNKLIKDYKSKKEAVKWKYAFPGCGEKKDNDKYGDYIILHEIIKFMKENNSDAIFLTADVSKADWLKKNKEPFIHYIEKVYKLTGKTLYIFDATKIIDFISFEDIYDLSHDGNYSEDEHFDRVKNEKMIKLYQELKEQIFSLPKIKLKVNKYYLSFIANSNVVDIQIQQKALKLWINLRKGELKGGYEITQDVSNKGTLGNGDYVIQLKSNKNFDEVMEIIRQSYNKNA